MISPKFAYTYICRREPGGRAYLGLCVLHADNEPLAFRLLGLGTTQEDQMRQIFGFMMGIMVGALVGSTVALLLAPESGETLRNELRLRGENLAADLRHAAEARQIELTNRLDALRESGTA
jgi:hypothetical protein